LIRILYVMQVGKHIISHTIRWTNIRDRW
jgi:hypothetical protein